MCGLFAVHDPRGVGSDPAPFLPALRRLSHRGPDDEGTFLSHQAFLGHRRLSILDLSTAGHQPMLSADGQVALVFNGQIYNWLELRSELEGLGHHFQSHCDTEVLLAAYLQWGEDCFGRLRGMWAVVLWDGRHGRLVVCRDRLGLKPLFVFHRGAETIFASEIKAICQYAPQAKKPDLLVLYRFLTCNWQDFDERTCFDGVTAFPPGTVTVIENGQSRSRPFWELKVRFDPTMTPIRLRDLYFDTVQRHLQGDVPVALALSGGVDSGSIACVASRILGMGDKMHAFSICPPNTPDESPLIDATVAYTGIRHTYVEVDEVDYPALLDEMIDFLDEPPPKANHLYQYLLRKWVGDHGYKVMLAGEAADEVFGGYSKYAPMYLDAMLRQGNKDAARAFLHGAGELTGKTPEQMLRDMRRYQRTGLGGRAVQEQMFGYELLAAGLSFPADLAFPRHEFKELDDPQRHALHREMLDRLRIDIPMINRIEDRNGMAHSLELRSPFLDHLLVEAGYSFAEADLMKGGINKWPLRQALDGVLTPAVQLERVKLRRPGSDTLVVYDKLANRMRALLGSQAFHSLGLFGPDLLSRFEQDRSAQNLHHAFVWFRVYVIGTWYERNIG